MPLQNITTAELLTELARRHDESLVIAVKDGHADVHTNITKPSILTGVLINISVMLGCTEVCC